MVKLGVWQHHPAGMGMAGDSTMKNLFFNYKSQILRCAQNDSIILLRRKAGCSTSVESSLQISLFLQNEPNPAPFSTSPGQVLLYCIKECKLFEINRLCEVTGIRMNQSGVVYDYAGKGNEPNLSLRERTQSGFA
jgi:hypothetical protein